jgi:hypothetical protein
VTDEHTPAERPLGRQEYQHLLTRFNDLEGHCIRAADASLAAHQVARTAMWMRSSWGPYVVSGLAFAMAFAACVSTR